MAGSPQIDRIKNGIRWRTIRLRNNQAVQKLAKQIETNDENSNHLMISSASILYEQNFDTETPADETVWRIPDGWGSNNYQGDYSGGSSTYPYLSEPKTWGFTI